MTTSPLSPADLLDIEARVGVPFDPRLRSFLLNPMWIAMQPRVRIDLDVDMFLLGLLPPDQMISGKDAEGAQVLALFKNSWQWTVGPKVHPDRIGPEIEACVIDEDEHDVILEFSSIFRMEEDIRVILPYSQGCTAYDQGLGEDANPYDPTFNDHALWEAGWTWSRQEDSPLLRR